MTNPKRHSAETSMLNDGRINRIVEEAVVEDLGLGDITTESIVQPSATGIASIVFKESGILAGMEVAELVFKIVDHDINVHAIASDGEWVDSNSVVARIEGPLAGILKGERTALNILQRMSGIATMTKKFVDAVHGTNAKITDTRKTAPGLRVLDKRAVQLGGGVNHRFGLDNMVLIKDNHIAAAGGIASAIDRCLSYLRSSGLPVKVEVETKNLDEVNEALRHRGIHRIMLDNFPIDLMREAVRIINGKVEVEASGNVNLETVRAIAETGVDFISVGALTHSPKALDISLDVKPIP